MKRMRFKALEPISRDNAEAVFASGSLSAVCHALACLVHHDPDWRWLQDKCIQMTSHPDLDVAGLAVTSFGHIARIHGNLDLGTVLPLLERLQDNPELAGRVQDALDDIAMYLPSGSRK